jgi:putative ABC transport system permease protein
MVPCPSELFRTLIRCLLGPGEQDVLGDLDEEFERRVRHRGRWRGEMWYMSEAISLAIAIMRLGRRTGRRADGAGGPRRMGHMTREGGMGGLGRDLRHTARNLARDKANTLVIGITLAVSIGSTTAIVAVADAAFLRPLPYPSAERLVRVYSGARDDPDAVMQISPLDLRDLEEHDAVIEEVGAWSVGESVHLTGAEEPRRLQAPRASASLFHMLGLEAELGRFFTAGEEVPGADDAVVLSHSFWIDAFGGDEAVVGTTLVLDGRSYRVIGVAPRRGALPPDADVWRPLALGPEWYEPGRWGWQFLNGVARLRPGIDPADASRALTLRLAESVPERVERGQTRVVRTLYSERLGDSGPGLLLLVGAVGMLLVLACANVMNMILVRAEGRAREFALRRALGSGGRSLVRLVALETAALAAVGGLSGLLVAHLAVRAARAADVSALPYLEMVRIDLRVASFALVLTVATAALFGIVPVLRALRVDPQVALRESGARPGSSRSARRMRDGLVVTQVAMACVLLVAVGLTASAFRDLLERDPGFRADGVLTATIELPANAYQGDEAAAFYRSLMEAIREIPGVESAGAVAFLPLSGVGWSASFDLVDPDPAVTDPDPGGNMRPVTTGYFETLGIPVVAGRTFTDADDASASPVVIVDETLARRYWPGGSPIGRQVLVGALSREPATIVGVVGALPDESLARAGAGHVYFPVLQRAERRMTLVARADGDPASLAPPLRAAIRGADPRIPVTELTTLPDRIRDSLAAPRTGLLLLGAFAAVALVLAAVGVYGVLAYAVASRTGEIGTRMALGATPGAVRGSVVGQAMRLWAIGALLGGAGAVATAGLLARYVEGVRAADPLPYALALLGLGAVAMVAALFPAMRATTVDPASALRSS